MTVDPDKLDGTEANIYWEGYKEGYKDADSENEHRLSQGLLEIKRLPTKRAVEEYIDNWFRLYDKGEKQC